MMKSLKKEGRVEGKLHRSSLQKRILNYIIVVDSMNLTASVLLNEGLNCSALDYSCSVTVIKETNFFVSLLKR